MFNWLTKGKVTKPHCETWDSWSETVNSFFDSPRMGWVHWQIAEFIVELVEFFDIPTILRHTKYGQYPSKGWSKDGKCQGIYDAFIGHWQFGILFRYHSGGDGKRWLFRLYSWRKGKRVGRIREFFFGVGCRLQERWDIVI